MKDEVGDTDIFLLTAVPEGKLRLKEGGLFIYFSFRLQKLNVSIFIKKSQAVHSAVGQHLYTNLLNKFKY